MSRHDGDQVEIYIGDSVRYASERAILERLVQLLGAARQPAIVLANISIEGQQIDALVATGSLALVIEAKAFNRPVRGGENGPWQVRLASGQWKNFRNPYLQAREAALAVRDAMGVFNGSEAPYPGAAVVFVPAIPQGSVPFPGDFKVSVTGLDGLEALLRSTQRSAWPIERWRAFATHLGLTSVSSVATACDRSLAEAETLLRQYSTAYKQTYADLVTVVPFPCRADEAPISSDDVVRRIAAGQAEYLVRGPSGCGKTLLAGQAACAFAAHGGVAVTLSIRDYADSLKGLLDREVGLLIGRPATTVLGAARRANRPLLFVVDGYNECAPSEQPSLSRGLAALAQVYEANLLITSQCPIARSDLLSLRAIKVAPAAPETKTAIALNITGGDTLPEQLEPLLDSVTTGLEARLIGEVGRDLSGGKSRYALFDLFVRKRLAEAATDGIALLSRIAGWLSERIAFSLSNRDLDRLLEEHHVPSALADRLHTAGLLTRHGDRVSFVHELFLDAFAAEYVLRQATGDAEKVLRALAAPRNDGRKTLIVGAIDDDTLLAAVLAGVIDGATVKACMVGACGMRAQTWAIRQCAALWDRLRAEVAGLRFRIIESGWNGVAFEESSLTTWTPSERAFLAAMPQWMVEGNHLDSALDTIDVLDDRIAEEADRLRTDARERKVANQSDLFASAYVDQSVATPGITRILTSLHSSFFRTESEPVVRIIERRLAAGRLSPGQLYLLLALSRGTRIAAPTIAATIETHWPTAPYHLRLDLLDAARMSRSANDDDRVALISALEALPDPGHIFISSMIVEALQGLGALEDSEREHVTVVREQVEQCLADPKDPDRQALAYGLHSAQFDHPYAGAYCEVIADLSEHERKALFTMAADGADDTALFLGPLLMELASFGDPSVSSSITRWTALPPKDCFMPQDAIAVFVISHIVLAHLGCILPDRRDDAIDPPTQALLSYGTILYWCNRADLDEDGKRRACDTALRRLAKDGFNTALNVIRHCEHALIHETHRLTGNAQVERSILSQFAAETADICRRALRDADSQTGYFQHYSDFDRRQDMTLAMDVLAHHGHSTDVELIKGYADDSTLGKQAIEAAKSLEERLGAS